MKITHTLLALAALGFLGQSALADTAGPFGFTISQNGHGGYHFLYYQTTGLPDSMTVALETPSGGISAPLNVLQRAQSDNGNVRFVIGTNQHAQATAAYIPVSSNFGPARQ
jgi:hypothetical protein